MKKIKVCSKTNFLVVICLLLLSPVYANNDRLPDPKIQAGIAQVSGKVTNFHLKEGEEAPILTLTVSNPVTAEVGKFKTHLSEDGHFHFEVPIECNTTIGVIGSDQFDDLINVSLAANGETKLEITHDDTGNTKVSMVNREDLTSDDMINLVDVLLKMLDTHLPEIMPRYNMLIEDYLPYEIKKLERKLKVANNDSILSKNGKNYIANEFKLLYLDLHFFDYKNLMKLDYMSYNEDKDCDNFIPREPGRSYYTFLKYFNLSDPQYLYNDYYPEVLQTILSNETLNIPLIKDTPIQDWLKQVKTIMTDLIGSDTGMFYDMLAANAYAKQFINELKPLTEKQKENIRGYFKNEEITKILLKKNEEIIKLSEENKQIPSIIDSTPAVPKEALMNAIISKYKGKAVLVDFWATWCGPCMEAMKYIREIKSAMKDKNIVFVYITDDSSPKALWEEKIKAIGGEHYYLKGEKMEYVQGKLGFDAIPTYLFYDTKGVLKDKVTGYPGTEKMQKMIEGLLL